MRAQRWIQVLAAPALLRSLTQLRIATLFHQERKAAPENCRHQLDSRRHSRRLFAEAIAPLHGRPALANLHRELGRRESVSLSRTAGFFRSLLSWSREPETFIASIHAWCLSPSIKINYRLPGL